MKRTTKGPVTNFICRRAVRVMLGTALAIGLIGEVTAAELKIPTQKMAMAIKELADQSGVQIMFSSDVVGNRESPALYGDYDTPHALDILLKDSGLTYDTSSLDGMILIRAAAKRISAVPPVKSNAQPASLSTQEYSPPVGLEEIIVTAQKREESLQEVPASIAVASGNQLQLANVKSIAELQRVVPGFTLKGGADSNNAVLFVRGVGTLVTSDAIQPSIATVIDGVVMGRSGLGLFNFDDIQRVEVLRGPQGTLFGMNASGGVLNMVTKSPTNELSGEFGVGYGSYNEIRTHGAISGPLIGDVLLGRLSFYTDKRDGYIRNIYSHQDVNDENQKGVRGKLLFLPRDTTRITLNVDAVNSDRICCVFTDRTLDTSFFASFVPITQANADATGAVAGTRNRFINGLGSGPFSSDRVRGASVEWNEAIGEYSFTSISAYRTWTVKDASTLDITTAFDQVLYADSTLDQSQWSQEFRLASPKGGLVDYVVGTYFFGQRVAADHDALYDLTAYAFPVIASSLDHSVTKTRNDAIFGDANVHLSNDFTAFGGLRWTHEKVDLHLVGLPRPAGQFPLFVPPGTVDDDVTVSKFSGRLGARWQFNDDDMVYVVASRGYKGPGFNSTSGIPLVSQRVKPETTTAYEVGLKSQWANRLRTNIAVFDETFRDFQAQGLIGTPPTVISAIINAGKLKTRGVELEMEAVPTDSLTINFSAAYIDAKFKDFPSAPCFSGQLGGCVGGSQNLAGKPLSSVPKWSGNVSGTYEFPISSKPVRGFVRAEYSWRDKVQWDVFQNPATISSSNGQLGASLGIRDAAGKYSVTVYGKNLTNKVPQSPLVAAGVTGAGTQQLLPYDYKHVYGINLEYAF